MKLYKDLRNERFGLYVKTTCPHCGEELVINYNEFKRILYKPIEKEENTIVIDLKNFQEKQEKRTYIGSSDYRKDKYEYTCCNCGKNHKITHAHYIKNTCNFLGNNNKIFFLTEEETKKAKKFREKCNKELKLNPLQKDALGMSYEYRIIPGGLGHLVYMKNTYTNKEVCLSNTDNW